MQTEDGAPAEAPIEAPAESPAPEAAEPAPDVAQPAQDPPPTSPGPAAAHDPTPPTPAPSPATASPGPTRPAFGVGKYTMARGDTMFSIARKLELSLSVLTTVNNIADPNAVKAGQVLLIPAQPGSVHVAARNESLQAIAEQYDIKVDALREANRLEKDARLDAGQLVLIPGVVRASASIRPLPASAAAVVLPPSESNAPASPKSIQPAPASAANTVNLKPAPGAVGDTMIWPVTGPLSTTFSPSHRGLDVVANQGTPIKAALAGRVVGAAEGSGPYGWYVLLEHGGNFTTVYSHLSKIRVKVGDTVDKGQVVGEVGSTGLSTGPHLHFELRQNNVPIDPRPYLP